MPILVSELIVGIFRDLGVSVSVWFQRLFRRTAGMTPAAFRKKRRALRA